jgi:hypothetical protein
MITPNDPLFTEGNRKHVAKRLNQAADAIARWRILAIMGWLTAVLIFLFKT